MSIRIITDSASDIMPIEAEQLGIEVLPLTVTFGERSYKDGVELSFNQFFEKLIESDELPTTSQIPPSEYEAAFSRSEDDIVVVTISSKLSGCCQSALIAAQGRSNVYVVDSMNATIGERILVMLAARLRNKGMSAKDIAAELEKQKDNIRTMGLLDTLEYLKRGGRISKAAAFAGGLLGIKPVVAVHDGEVVLLGKARGSKNGSNMLKSQIEKEPVDFSMPFYLAFSGLDDTLLRKYVRDSSDLYPCRPDELPVSHIGSVIGTHVGPGAIAVSFFVKKD